MNNTKMEICPNCEGAGQYEVEDRRYITTHSINQIFESVTCPECDGDGQIEILEDDDDAPLPQLILELTQYFQPQEEKKKDVTVRKLQ